MRDPEYILSCARDLYEGTHGMSMAKLAEITSIPRRTLGLRARQEDWAKKQSTKTGDSTEAAIRAAEFFADREHEIVAAEEETNAHIQVLTDPLPAEREALLERHRKEWIAPRAMSTEAIQIRNQDPLKAMERAKLAKITAETLKIVQDGERKSHGMDVGVDVPQGHVVVIERAQ